MSRGVPRIVLDLLALPPEASSVAPEVDALHVVVISISMLGATAVALMVLYFVVRYRRRGDDRALTPRVEATRLAEGLVIGGILILFLVFWVVGYRQYVRMQDAPKDALTVYVTAKQWMWKFSYPDGRKSNDVLVVPAGRAVRLVMTSRDVIHSFFVPAFRQKRDVLPGRYVATWFEATRPGTYPIYCAEFCGVSHSAMLGSVRVLGPEDYEAWLREPRADVSGDDALAAEGARVAVRRACVACHTVTGQPHVGPTWSGLFGAPVTLEGGQRVVADEAYLTRAMMEPNAEVVLGYRPVMPAYMGVLTQTETAALLEYIKSLRGAPRDGRAGEGSSGVTLPRVVPVDPSTDAGAR